MLPGLVFVTSSDDKHREAQTILGILVVAGNAVIYAWALRRPRPG